MLRAVELERARALALDLLAEHGLSDWTFTFDRAKRRFGACNYTTRTVSLSRTLTEQNSEAQVLETLLHEIAHALTPGAGHGKAWREACKSLGIAPRRCFSATDVELPPPRYWLVCDSCGLKLPRHRRSRKTFACKTCCDALNGGRYSKRFTLRFELYTPE